MELKTRFHVRQPAVVDVSSSVIDMETGLVLMQTPMGQRVRDRVESVAFATEWTVPPMPPGDYRRVTAAFGLGLGSQPAFFVVYFSVPDGCEQ